MLFFFRFKFSNTKFFSKLLYIIINIYNIICKVIHKLIYIYYKLKLNEYKIFIYLSFIILYIYDTIVLFLNLMYILYKKIVNLYKNYIHQNIIIIIFYLYSIFFNNLWKLLNFFYIYFLFFILFYSININLKNDIKSNFINNYDVDYQLDKIKSILNKNLIKFDTIDEHRIWYKDLIDIENNLSISRNDVITVIAKNYSNKLEYYTEFINISDIWDIYNIDKSFISDTLNAYEYYINKVIRSNHHIYIMNQYNKLKNEKEQKIENIIDDTYTTLKDLNFIDDIVTNKTIINMFNSINNFLENSVFKDLNEKFDFDKQIQYNELLLNILLEQNEDYVGSKTYIKAVCYEVLDSLVNYLDTNFDTEGDYWLDMSYYLSSYHIPIYKAIEYEDNLVKRETINEIFFKSHLADIYNNDNIINYSHDDKNIIYNIADLVMDTLNYFSKNFYTIKTADELNGLLNEVYYYNDLANCLSDIESIDIFKLSDDIININIAIEFYFSMIKQQETNNNIDWDNVYIKKYITNQIDMLNRYEDYLNYIFYNFNMDKTSDKSKVYLNELTKIFNNDINFLKNTNNIKNGWDVYNYENLNLKNYIDIYDKNFIKLILDYTSDAEKKEAIHMLKHFKNIYMNDNYNNSHLFRLDFYINYFRKIFDINLSDINQMYKIKDNFIDLESPLLTITPNLIELNNHDEFRFDNLRDFEKYKNNINLVHDKTESVNSLIELNTIISLINSKRLESLIELNDWIDDIENFNKNYFDIKNKFTDHVFHEFFRYNFCENLHETILINNFDIEKFNNIKLNLLNLELYNERNTMYDIKLEKTYVNNELPNVITVASTNNNSNNLIGLNFDIKNYNNMFYNLSSNNSALSNYYISKFGSEKEIELISNILQYFESIKNPFYFWESLAEIDIDSYDKNLINLKKYKYIYETTDNINDLLENLNNIQVLNDDITFDNILTTFYEKLTSYSDTFCDYINTLNISIENSFNKNKNNDLLKIVHKKENNYENILKFNEIYQKDYINIQPKPYSQLFDNIFDLNFIKYNFRFSEKIINHLSYLYNYILNTINYLTNLTNNIYYKSAPYISELKYNLINYLDNFFIYNKIQHIYCKSSNFLKIKYNQLLDLIYFENISYFIYTIIILITIYILILNKNNTILKYNIKFNKFLILYIQKKDYMKNKKFILNFIKNLNIEKKIEIFNYCNNSELNNFTNLLYINIKFNNTMIIIKNTKAKLYIFFKWLDKKYCFNLFNNIIYYIIYSIKNIKWNILNKQYSIFGFYINFRKNFKKNKNENFKNTKY
jgi:hypothetical protein